MLIARVKATQEREVPELADRLAAVETFQSIGEEVYLFHCPFMHRYVQRIAFAGVLLVEAETKN